MQTGGGPSREKSKMAKETATKAKKKTGKYNLPAHKAKKAELIIKHYAETGDTIENTCDLHGLTKQTFNVWAVNSSQLSEHYKKAKDQNYKARKNITGNLAFKGLQRLIIGYEVEEVETEELRDKKGNIVTTRIKKKKKHIAANVTAIIFALKNTKPSEWNNENNFSEETETQVFKLFGQTIKF